MKVKMVETYTYKNTPILQYVKQENTAKKNWVELFKKQVRSLNGKIASLDFRMSIHKHTMDNFDQLNARVFDFCS